MLTKYLSQDTLVSNVETVRDLEGKISLGKPLNIMMGQTFDSGQPLDMMKYALFIMNLADLVGQESVAVKANWLLADHFMVEINKDKSYSEAGSQVSQRRAYLERLNQVYGGNVGVVLSSDLSKRDEYSQNLNRLFAEANRNPKFKELVLQAVPKDRRGEPSALDYPFEELATIQTMGADIKVGPPYERFYDSPAREFAPVVGFNKYVAIQLGRSFPLGNPVLSEALRKEIEEFGILPYKINSKGLQKFRIDPISDDLDQINDLILSTEDPRAIVDLLVIAEQSQQRLSGGSSLSLFSALGSKLSPGQNIDILKELAVKSYGEFIHKPLRSYQE